MRQSRTMSMVEAATNVVVGYVLAIATQIVVERQLDAQAAPQLDELRAATAGIPRDFICEEAAPGGAASKTDVRPKIRPSGAGRRTACRCGGRSPARR